MEKNNLPIKKKIRTGWFCIGSGIFFGIITCLMPIFLFLPILGIVSGIGIIKNKTWGWWLAIVYSVIMVLISIFGVFMSFNANSIFWQARSTASEIKQFQLMTSFGSFIICLLGFAILSPTINYFKER